MGAHVIAQHARGVRALLLCLVAEERRGWLLVVVAAGCTVGHVVERGPGVEVRGGGVLGADADGVVAHVAHVQLVQVIETAAHQG